MLNPFKTVHLLLDLGPGQALRDGVCLWVASIVEG